jgi:hypothetical protein
MTTPKDKKTDDASAAGADPVLPPKYSFGKTSMSRSEFVWYPIVLSLLFFTCFVVFTGKLPDVKERSMNKLSEIKAKFLPPQSQPVVQSSLVTPPDVTALRAEPEPTKEAEPEPVEEEEPAVEEVDDGPIEVEESVEEEEGAVYDESTEEEEEPAIDEDGAEQEELVKEEL